MGKIISIKRAGFGFIVQFLCYFVAAGNIPLVNTHIDSLGYSPVFIGIGFSLVTFTYALGMPLC